MRRGLWTAVLSLSAVYLCRSFTSALEASDSIPALVQRVLDRHPATRAAEARVSQAESGLKEIQMAHWPGLSVESSATRGDNPVYVFGSLLGQRRFGPQNFVIDTLNAPDILTNYRNALVLGLPVFTGLDLQSNQRIQERYLEQARIERTGLDQQLRFQTIDITLQILLSQELLRAIDERISSSEGEVDSARKLNARGLVLGSDFHAAQAILSGLKAQRSRLYMNHEAAKESLAVLLGEPAFPAGQLTEKFTNPENDDQLWAIAHRQRPDLRVGDHQIEAARFAYKQSGRSFWPRINAFASVETNSEDFSSNPSNRMVGLQSSLSIGDPLYFARKERARNRYDEAQRTKESAEDRVRMEIIQASRGYQGLMNSLPDAIDAVERAQKSLELFRPLYREGRQSIIEVLRAEEGLMKAQTFYFETLYHLHLGYTRLRLVTGSLDEEAVRQIAANLGTN